MNGVTRAQASMMLWQSLPEHAYTATRTVKLDHLLWGGLYVALTISGNGTTVEVWNAGHTVQYNALAFTVDGNNYGTFDETLIPTGVGLEVTFTLTGTNWKDAALWQLLPGQSGHLGLRP